MKPIFAKLRTDGYLSTFYLDDSLLIGNSQSECLQNIKATCDILRKAGFVINDKKSSFIPSQEITYLGFILNSKTMTISLPNDKRQKFIHFVYYLKINVTLSLEKSPLLLVS